MASPFLHIPYWRSGGFEGIQYRTQLYFTPLSRETVTLGIYLFENGGEPWAGRTFDYEIDQHVDKVTTNRDGMISITLGGGQIVRVQINVLDHEYGTGEVHLLEATEETPLLARGEVEVFAQEEAGGFELSISEVTITGGRPVVVDPPR